MAKKQKINQSNPKLIRQRQVLFGGGLMLVALLLSIAFGSYLINWKSDFSTIGSFTDKTVVAKNLLNKVGAILSHYFIYQGVGLAAVFFPYLLGLTGYKLFFNSKTNHLISSWAWGISHLIWLCITLGYFFPTEILLSGLVGFEINVFMISYIGSVGVLTSLAFFFLCFIVLELEWTPEKMKQWWIGSKNKEVENKITNDETLIDPVSLDEDSKDEIEIDFDTTKSKNETPIKEPILKTDELIMEVETLEEELVDEKLANSLVEKQGFFDPTLELSNFKMPNIELLKDYGDTGITINQEELEANKNKIVETLNNYKIGISNIKATIGPTVTLYEIVPDAGIRISKIKNLEDDIALSLAALGIRIIAPIPGKGTIGIEVPNQSQALYQCDL